MPSYLVRGKYAGVISGNCCNTCVIDKKSSLFFNTLATRLLEMSHAIEERIEDIKKNCNGPKQANGFLFASIDTPQMNITVGEEYVIYVQRHGPPHHGKFDQHKLNHIRKEYGIPIPPPKPSK